MEFECGKKHSTPAAGRCVAVWFNFSAVLHRCCVTGSNTLVHSEALAFFSHHCVLAAKSHFDFCLKYMFPFFFLLKKNKKTIRWIQWGYWACSCFSSSLPIPKDCVGISCCAAECLGFKNHPNKKTLLLHRFSSCTSSSKEVLYVWRIEWLMHSSHADC